MKTELKKQIMDGKWGSKLLLDAVEGYLDSGMDSKWLDATLDQKELDYWKEQAGPPELHREHWPTKRHITALLSRKDKEGSRCGTIYPVFRAPAGISMDH